MEQATEIINASTEKSIMDIRGAGAEITESLVADLERAAKLVPRWKQQIDTIMVSCTYPNDWTIQGHGDKARACLSSAGAERIAMAIGGFEMSEHREPVKVEFDDANGKGYYWTYTMLVTWKGRSCIAEGTFSTRDKFLGFADGEWKDTADINEADIRRAARHVAFGEGVKQLLGLRGLPADAMPKFGMQVNNKVERSTGHRTQEDKTGDKDKQKKIWSMCLEMTSGDEDAAKELFFELASFEGRDGDMVKPRSLSGLTGRWLNTAYGKVKEAHANWQKETGGEQDEQKPEPGAAVGGEQDDTPF